MTDSVHTTAATRRLQAWEWFLIGVLLVIVVANSILSPQYLALSNQINLFQLSIEKAIAALAMVQADPGGAGGAVEQGVEQRPV